MLSPKERDPKGPLVIAFDDDINNNKKKKKKKKKKKTTTTTTKTKTNKKTNKNKNKNKKKKPPSAESCHLAHPEHYPHTKSDVLRRAEE